jgi:hypothetical protein
MTQGRRNPMLALPSSWAKVNTGIEATNAMSDEIEPRPETSRTAAYEIRVSGHLGPAWSDWFAGLHVTREDDGDTMLAGLLDQAALHGVLRRVRDLGLPLISVTRIESGRRVPRASVEKRS